jgi:RNA polymerase sigma-70 factor (ECF subfamily)
MPDEEGLDRALMVRVAAGDAAAFESLVACHRDSVFRYARSLAGDQSSAEDALQETFLAAWRGASSWRGEGSLRGWLFTIARNFVFRASRSRAGEPDETVPLSELGELAGWGAGDDPAEMLRRREERRLVERALASLAPADREILVLRELEGFTGDEAASMLGLTLAAQKTRLHRARLRFAAALRGTVRDD